MTIAFWWDKIAPAAEAEAVAPIFNEQIDTQYNKF